MKSKSKPSKTYLVRHVLLLIIFCLPIQACRKATTREDKALRKFEILLDWQAEPTYLGVYYAKHLGLFERLGLDLSIIQSWGANAAVAAVAGGKYEIATASGGATVLGYEVTTNVVSLGVLYPQIPTVIYGLASAALNSPGSLKGKKIGVYPGSITVNEFEDFIFINKLNTNEFSVLSISGADIPLLRSGQVDAVLHYHEMSPVQVETMQDFPLISGRRTSEIRLANFGVKGYGLNLVTSKTALAKDGVLLRKIAEAIFEGYRQACAHPDEATASFISQFPDKDPIYVKESFQRVKNLIGENYGNQTVEGWAATIKVYSDLGLLPHSINPTELIP